MIRLPVTLAFLAALAGCGSPTPVAPPPRVTLAEGPATAVVASLATAFAAHDAETAGGLAADADARSSLTAAVGNLDELGISVGAMRFVDDDPAVSSGLPRGRFAAVAAISWAIDGFDQQPAEAEVTVLLEQRDGVVRVAGFGGGERPLPLWLTGDLTVRRTPGVLVLGMDPAAVERVDRLAQVAHARVGAALGDTTPLVVEVPATGADVDRVLGSAEGEHAAIAAVTTPVGRDTGPGTPVHVVVNPQVLGALGDDGAQIVMTHEVTHLVTDAVHAQSPLWLLEGYADHVALRGSALPLSRTAAQIGAQVREDGAPETLPAASAFDAQAAHLGALYESAWRAVEVLVAAGGGAGGRGEALVHELYRRTAAGESVDVALRALYGFGEEELTRRWRADLSAIAASISP